MATHGTDAIVALDGTSFVVQIILVLGGTSLMLWLVGWWRRQLWAESRSEDDVIIDGTNFKPGEWVRPLGNMETLLAVCGNYGTMNTTQAFWLTSTLTIKSFEVEKALYHVAKTSLGLQLLIERCGLRYWFRMMDEFVVDFCCETSDPMKVFYDELAKPFNMKCGPLWRARLVLLEPTPEGCSQAVLILTAQHAINDGVTNMLFIKDLINVLNALMTGSTPALKIRPIIPAMADNLKTMRHFPVIVKYFCTKLHDVFIKDFVAKSAFNALLPRPDTKLLQARHFRKNFSIEVTNQLLRHCKEAQVTVHAGLMAAANVALFRLAQERSQGTLLTAMVNNANCVNMRRYFPKAFKDMTGCHISVEESEMVITNENSTTKEGFWMLARALHQIMKKNLDVDQTPIIISPLLYPATIIIPINNFLTRIGSRNRFGCHIGYTNMGILENMLPDNDKGPVRLTDTLRSGTANLIGVPFFLAPHTLGGRLMVSIDYYTNLLTDEVAAGFFENISKIIDCIASTSGSI